MYRKILIANRGEIACRIAPTLARMGIAAATVHSDADADALHVRAIGESVRIGAGPARESYLDIAAVVAAARRVGADAVHPGFGFLSENADFARACADAGIAFIGPSPQVLALFGDKAAAKRLARRLDIPTAGGLDAPSDDVEALLAAVAQLPRPFILKAVAGGGGKGMRVVRERDEDVRHAIASAIREGRSAFGDGRLIAERYLEHARHIEVQVLGDGAGNVVHLYDRECTLQRRYQKVVEEAPVTSIAQALREQLWAHAVALCQAVDYLGLGTVEFAVTEAGAVFLEVNPRLQVEHPVTEAITGLDLVQLQVETVARRQLPLAQGDLPPARGVAVQARLYAEDAAQGFLPATGRIAVFEAPAAIRTDAGVESGSEITSHYDPMIAKLVAHADSREDAQQRLRSALRQTTVLGVTSNRSFLLALLDDPQVRRNAITTEFIDGWLAAQPAAALAPADVAALMALWLAGRRTPSPRGGAWHDAHLTGWRIARGGPASAPATWEAAAAGGKWKIGFGASPSAGRFTLSVDGQAFEVDAPDAPSSQWQRIAVDGTARRVRAHCTASQVCALLGDGELTLDLRPLHDAVAGAAGAAKGTVRAPMMGVMIAIDAAEGQQVDAGQRLGTMESMKMEMAITAPAAGRITWVGCEVRGKVERHQELFRIAAN
ncbi:MAG: biotin carboxylase N-terminal domain-containing protein [Ramlibacter sp.]